MFKDNCDELGLFTTMRKCNPQGLLWWVSVMFKGYYDDVMFTDYCENAK